MLLPMMLGALAAIVQVEAPEEARPLPDNPWIYPGDYPADALRAGAQGDVEVRLQIDRAGHVTGCTVTRSSGNASLDGATCRAITLRARFEPSASVAARTYRRRVSWRLPDGGGLPFELGRGGETVESDGTAITGCRDLDGAPTASGIAASSCRHRLPAPLIAWLQSLEGQAAVTMALTIEPQPGAPAPAPPPEWGRLASLVWAQVRLNPDGSFAECRETVRQSPIISFPPDLCRLMAAPGTAIFQRARPGEGERRGRLTLSVHVRP